MDWFENVEHFAIILGVIATSFGLVKGIRGWRKERKEAAAARVRHEDAIARVLRHLDNGGLTLVTKVDAGNKMLADHIEEASEWFKNNDLAHKEIHSRIDEVLLSERNRRDG